MISRADNIVNAHIDLFSVMNDALCCDPGPSKTNQEGTKHQDHPFHLYSVAENPTICVVTAMCRYLICNPTILNGGVKLFEGSSQYERYFTILRDIVRSPEHHQTFVDLGMHPDHFGTHSIRKGAVTHVATGMTSSPPIASICIRTNWSMPGVMNRYIKYKKAGDQYVGRCVSGKKRTGKSFA
jgi:hypothetical protein